MSRLQRHWHVRRVLASGQLTWRKWRCAVLQSCRSTGGRHALALREWTLGSMKELAKMRLRRCQRLFSQYASILLSLECLSQLLNNDLLETVNYSALKQKLISFLIIWIRLMDEYLKIARQAVKTKIIISSHYLSLQIRIITTLQPSKWMWVLRLTEDCSHHS